MALQGYALGPLQWPQQVAV